MYAVVSHVKSRAAATKFVIVNVTQRAIALTCKRPMMIRLRLICMAGKGKGHNLMESGVGLGCTKWSNVGTSTDRSRPSTAVECTYRPLKSQAEGVITRIGIIDAALCSGVGR